MLRVGLTGGLATGKSYVGTCLESMGCHLVHADELGHRVLAPDGEAYRDVIQEFGSGILDEGGLIDRRKLAAEVFSKPDRLEKLNSLVHPAVFTREEHWMEEIRAVDPDGIVIVEAAILIETGSYQRFSRLILTVCSEEQQIERAMRRDGVTREQVLARLSRQLPLEEKRKFADYIIDTSGSKEDTLLQTREVYNSLRSMVQV